MKKTSKYIVWINILIGILCLPAYLHLGEFFKYLIAPYIVYMVWSKKTEYFPALIIHITPGSIVSYLILITTLVISVQHFRTWRKLQIRYIFFISLLPLPIFIWQTVDRFFMQNLGLIQSMIPLDMYLGLFPFFYGTLLSRKMNLEVWRAIFIVLFFSLGVELLELKEYFARALFFALPALVSLAIYLLLFRHHNIDRNIKIIAVLALAYFISKINLYSFTVIGSTGIATLLLIGFKRKFTTLSRLISSKWAFIVTMLLVFYAVTNQSRLRSIEALDFDMSNFKITDIDMLRTRLYKKTFDDRAPLWLAVWNNVIAEKNILPPMELKEYEIENFYGTQYEANFGAHNIFLELLRQFGVIIGPITGLSFILIVISAGKLLLLKNLSNSFLIITASTVVAVGIIGGMTGQYPLLSTFSLLYIGLAGVCYGTYFQTIISGPTIHS